MCSLASLKNRDHLTTKFHKAIVVDRFTKLSLMAQHIPYTQSSLSYLTKEPKNIRNPCLGCLLSSWKALWKSQIIRNKEDREEREHICIHEECLINICDTKYVLMTRGHLYFYFRFPPLPRQKHSCTIGGICPLQSLRAIKALLVSFCSSLES